jgi:16S rRNA G966 N2-methylase RsmD
MTLEQLIKTDNRPSQGVVKTHIELVREVIERIPRYIMKSSTTTFLEPCFGSGTFIFELIKELRKYGHSVENIQNRIYGFEISHGSINRVKKNLSKYNFKNIHNTNFLTYNFKNMKFDVILGNPPYQQPQQESKRWTLWSKFIEKSNELSPEYLAFVIPHSWLGPNKEHDLIFKNLTYASLDVDKYFNVGSTFSYIICSQNPSNEVLINNGSQTISVPRTTEFLPNDTRFISVNNKFFNRPTFGFIRTTEHHTANKNDWSCEDGEFEIFHSHAQSFKSNKRPLRYSYEGYKALITLSGYSNFLIKNNIGASQIGAWMEINESEVESTNSILNSKLYQKMLHVNKWSGWNSLPVIKSLPSMPLNKIYTDQEIYSYFDLSPEEILLIEE